MKYTPPDDILAFKEKVKEYHKNQKRKFTGEPYWVHPFAVAEKSVDLAIELWEQKNYLARYYLIYVTALSHDIVEDCFADNETGLNELEEYFYENLLNAGESRTARLSIAKLTKIRGYNSNYRHLKYLQQMMGFEFPEMIIKLCDIENNLTSPEIAPDFETAFRRIITDSGMDVTQLRKKAGITESAFMEIYTGQLKEESMEKISIALNKEPDYLSISNKNIQTWTYEKYQEYFTVLELNLNNNSIHFTKLQKKKLLEKINELREL